MPSVPGPLSAGTEGDGAVCAPGSFQWHAHLWVCHLGLSWVTERKTTGRTDKAETLSLSWKKHHQLAGKLRKLFWKVISENILLLRDLSSIYWESASWKSFWPQHTMWVAGGFSHTLCSSVDLLSEFSAVVEEEGSGFGPPLCPAVLLVWWCCVLVTVKDCISLCGFPLSYLSLRDKNSLFFSLPVNN